MDGYSEIALNSQPNNTIFLNRQLRAQDTLRTASNNKSIRWMFCFRARVNDASDYILTINDESDCLRKKIASAITYYLGGGGGGGARKMGPFGSFTPPLKNP
jgi:hypothetical protein